jgi:hypothetical protein
MPYGESQEHEAPPAFEEKDLNWNTHRKIKEAFGFPDDDELFAVWLDWFYQRLSADQRRTLRKAELSHLNLDEFPRPHII